MKVGVKGQFPVTFSRAESPLYKGKSSDDVRDGDIFTDKE